jgi:ABC-type antimicrobial peptide transport system permease subunit
MHIIVRTSRAASEVVGLMRATITGLDPALPLIDVKSASDVVASSAREQELVTDVLEAFAVAALLLAAIGLYGVISYSVAQRTQELGIRAALGAGRADLVRLVLIQSLGLTAVGVFVGGVSAIAASGLVSSQLFGVAARDPRIYATVGILVFVMSLLAAALPTLRATRVNPLDALRSI